MSFLNNISRRKFVYGATCTICGSLILPSCVEVPLTQRKQLNFYKYNMPIVTIQGHLGGYPVPKIYANENALNKEVEKSYKKFVSKARENNILIENTNDSKRIKEIGIKISKSIEKYYIKIGELNPTNNFIWEFALIDQKDNDGNLIKNAWCMPGGKIAFYTGLMPITKNDDGIASIIGHEIAHAFARHTVEKLTQASIIGWTTEALGVSQYADMLRKNLDILGMNINIYGSLVNYGILLPFSRNMESEADYLSLVFMNLSGFNMQESIEMWKRMQSTSKKEDPPEFMSSHPSPENRIEKLKEWMPGIKQQYPTV